MTRRRVGRASVLGWLLVMGAACGKGPEPAAPVASTAPASAPQALDVVKVVSQALNATVTLPGELLPYEAVTLYPKVTGFVKWIGVDRGSTVKEGEVLVRLEAPELLAQRAESAAKLATVQSQLAAAQAKLASDESTFDHLKSASATAGVVAGNDLVVAEKAADASRANVRALTDAIAAATEALRAVAQGEAYLTITAPFGGVVTERDVHSGDLVGPASGRGAATALLRIETIARLRLVVPVPEAYAAAVPQGALVSFAVADAPGEALQAPIARISHAVDAKTRTMPVELEVANADGRLTPGAFAQVTWPLRRRQPTLCVPPAAVTSNLERTFVIRVANGQTEWVDVKVGATSGTLTEVFGALHEGDAVIARATDAIRPGTKVK